MSITSSHSKLQTFFQMPSTDDPDSTDRYLRKTNFHSTLLHEDMDQNYQVVNGFSKTDSYQNTVAQEQQQKILDPERQDVEINDPKRGLPEREFPGEKDEDEDDEDRIKDPNRKL